MGHRIGERMKEKKSILDETFDLAAQLHSQGMELQSRFMKLGEGTDEHKKGEDFGLGTIGHDAIKLAESLKQKLLAIQKAKIHDWNRAVVDSVANDIDEKRDEVDGGIEILKQLENDSKAASKRDKAKASYADSKVAKKYLDKGAGKKLATVAAALEISASEECATPSEADGLKHDEVSIFGIGVIEGVGAVVDCVMALATAKSTDLIGKLNMKANSGMRGLYSQLDLQTVDLSGFKQMMQEVKNLPLVKDTVDGVAGAFAPFVVALRPSIARHGPSAWPLCGVACLVMVLTGNVKLTAFDLSLLRNKGKMMNYEQLDAALDARALRGHQWPKIALVPKSVAWLPYGAYPVPVTTDDEIASMLVIPWMNPDLPKPLGPDVWGLIESGIVTFGRKHEDSMPWKSLVPAFRKFADKVKF